MSLYSQYHTVRKYETEGKDMPFPQPDGSIIYLKIARTDDANRAYKSALQIVLKKHYSKGGIDLDLYEDPNACHDVCDMLAEHILTGWHTVGSDGKRIDGVLDQFGEVVKYGRDQARDLLSSLPELRKEILARAQNFRNFQESVTDEEIEKN